MRVWTDEEVCTLVSMWSTASLVHIANTLHRSPTSIGDKAKWLRDKGLLEGTKTRRRKTDAGRSIKPDPQDFDAVKMEYCREHRITVVELDARFVGDDQLAGQLYRLAQAAKLSRLRPMDVDNRPVDLAIERPSRL